MPKQPWTGYKRFCPLARGLDLAGERWTLIIAQELLSTPKRYSDLLARLPGIGTSVLADRLRKLERAGLVERRPGATGEPVVYALTDSGRALEEPLRAIRRWGVKHLVRTAPSPQAEEPVVFDVRYVDGIEALGKEEYELRVGESISTLSFSDGELIQRPGPAKRPALVVTTSESFMERWAAGDAAWDEGRGSGEVALAGDLDAWPRMLAATGYRLSYDPERNPDGDAGATD